MLIVLVTMLWLSVMGVLIFRPLLWTALTVSALSLASYFLIPESFYLALSLAGGGALIGAGLFLMRQRDS